MAVYIGTQRGFTILLDGKFHAIAPSHPAWAQITASLDDDDKLRGFLNPTYGIPAHLHSYPDHVLQRLQQYRAAGLLGLAERVLRRSGTLDPLLPVTSDGYILHYQDGRVWKVHTPVATVRYDELKNFFGDALVWDPPAPLEIDVGQIWRTRCGDQVEVLSVSDTQIDGEHEMFGFTTFTRDGRYYEDRQQSEDDLMEKIDA